MFSSLFNNPLLGLFIAVTFVAGCGFKLKEKPKPERVVIIQGVECLRDSVKGFKLFFDGNASDAQVDQSVTCLQGVLKTFKNNVRGENQDAYTPREVATFVEENFFKDGESFSDSFLVELMKFKVALIGGSQQLIHSSEIDRVIGLLEVIKPEMVRINKSMKITTMKWDTKLQPDNSSDKEKLFLSAKKDVNQFVRTVAMQFLKNGNSYQIDDLVNLIKEIVLFAKADRKTVEFIETVRPFFKKFKTTFIGGGHSIVKTEWLRLGQTLSEGLFQVLRIEYFLKELQEDQVEAKWAVYQFVAKDIAVLLEDLLVHKETHLLTNKEIHELTKILGETYPKLKLSEGLLDSIGQAKVALLGDTGPNPSIHWYWSMSDFSKLEAKIPFLFTKAAVVIKTYNAIKSPGKMDIRPDLPYTEFINASIILSNSADEIVNSFEGSYNLNHLKQLVIELSSGPLNDILKLPGNFESLFKVVKSIKTVVTGEDSQEMALEELKLFSKVAVRGLFNILQFELYVRPSKPDQEVYFKQLESFFNNVVTTLQLNLTYKKTHVFTNAEIDHLLQSVSVLYPNIKFPSELLDNVGHLKVALLGSKEDSPSHHSSWTHHDFIKLQKKSPFLFSNISIIIQAIKTIKQESASRLKTTLNYKDFSTAEMTIINSLDDIAALFEGGYDVGQIKQLLYNLSQGPLQEKLRLPENFSSLFEAGLSVKTLVTGEESNRLSAAEFKLLLGVGVRGLFNYFEYDLFVSPYVDQEIAYYGRLDQLLQKVVSTLSYNLTHKKSRVLTTSELIQVVMTLQKEEIIRTQIKPATLEKALDTLWSRILNKPEDRLAGKQRQYFDLETLQQLKAEASIFLKVQVMAATILKDESLSRPKVLELLSSELQNAASAELRQGLSELLQLISTGTALTFNKSGFLKILSENIGLYQRQDLYKSNMARALSRLLIRSYSNELDSVQQLKGLKLAEAQMAYDDFIELIIELNILEEVDPNFIPSRFREANLFLATSDGNDVASFTELHQLILHIFSGMARAEVIKGKVIELCVPPAADSKVSEVWEECLLNFYSTEADSFADLPQFIQLRLEFAPAQLQDYFLSLMKAAGHVPNERKVVKMKDADLFPHVVQYIEMVYTRFDSSKDNRLDKDEALAAYPIYQSLLTDILKKNFPQVKEENYPGVFIYLLKYGKPPTTLAEKLAFAKFIVTPERWDIQSTRLDLGKIFNYIAEATAPKLTGVAMPAAPISPPAVIPAPITP